jgi:hypothetical protein
METINIYKNYTARTGKAALSLVRELDRKLRREHHV